MTILFQKKFLIKISILISCILLPFNSSHSRTVQERDVNHLETFRKKPSKFEQSNSPYFEIVWENYKKRKHQYGVLGAFFSKNEWRPFYYFTSAKTSLEDAIKLFYFMEPFKTHGGTILFLNDKKTSIEEKNYFTDKYLHPNISIQSKKAYLNFTENKKNNNESIRNNKINLIVFEKVCKNIGLEKDTYLYKNCIESLENNPDLVVLEIKHKNPVQLPSYCSELYGCPPEKYDQEIEADKRYVEETLKCHQRNEWMKDLGFWSACGEVKVNGKTYKSVKSSGELSAEYQTSGIVTSLEYPDNIQNDLEFESIIGNLLKVGIIIGGSYLLGTSLGSYNLTGATVQPVDPGVLCATGLAGLC